MAVLRCLTLKHLQLLSGAISIQERPYRLWTCRTYDITQGVDQSPGFPFRTKSLINGVMSAGAI